jgi:hypothetical protein
VIIRRESTAWFADLDAQLARARYHYRQRVAERNGDHEGTLSEPATSWSLSPGQLCQLLGAGSRAAARVTAVLFPRVGAPRGGVTFEELDAEQALDAWRGALFRSYPPDGMFAIGPGSAARPEECLDRLAARLAARVPSVSCHLGPDAYGEAAHWLSSRGRGLVSRAARGRSGGRRP